MEPSYHDLRSSTALDGLVYVNAVIDRAAVLTLGEAVPAARLRYGARSFENLQDDGGFALGDPAVELLLACLR